MLNFNIFLILTRCYNSLIFYVLEKSMKYTVNTRSIGSYNEQISLISGFQYWNDYVKINYQLGSVDHLDSRRKVSHFTPLANNIRVQ